MKPDEDLLEEDDREEDADPSFGVSPALRAFYREVRRYKVLDEAQTVDLARRAKDGDRKAIEALVHHNLRLVLFFARRQRKSPRGVDLGDFIQEGIMGLWRAAEKFDYNRGFKFTTYATWWVRSKMQRFTAEQGSTIYLPVHQREFLDRLWRTRDEFLAEHHVLPSHRELALLLEVPLKRVTQAFWDLRVGNVMGLDDLLGQSEDQTLGDVLPDRSLSPEALAQAQEYLELFTDELRAFMERVAQVCSEREMDIFCLRFGLSGSGFKKQTLERIGQRHAVSRERVRQLEARVWRLLGEAGFSKDEAWLLDLIRRIQDLQDLTGRLGDNHSDNGLT